MKQPTYIFLLTAALAVLSWTAFAHEATTESESGAPAAEAAQTVAASESIDLAMLDFPLVPDFQVAEGGTCTPCSNHGQ